MFPILTPKDTKLRMYLKPKALISFFEFWTEFRNLAHHIFDFPLCCDFQVCSAAYFQFDIPEMMSTKTMQRKAKNPKEKSGEGEDLDHIY